MTGIIQGVRTIVNIDEEVGMRHLTISLGPIENDLAKNVVGGASIAINGCCLTVAGQKELNGEIRVTFDIMEETLDKTTLGELHVGHKVNVERSLRFGDELGGHQVSGHIDTTATITKIMRNENNCCFVFSFADNRWTKYIVNKGFIAVDGTSLTVVAVEDHRWSFCVCLIPETMARTTLGGKKVGDKVNVELDNQAKVIVKFMERVLPGAIEDFVSTHM